MIIVGLTGSIGMGKSTTAKMFTEAGVPVHDADATVHRLYSGRAAPLIEEAFPGTTADGIVDREKLSAAVLGKPEELRKLEHIIHPLVREEELAFIESQRQARSPVVVLDIPLLFETGGDSRVDRIVVVSASPEIQRERVLARDGMTEEKFEAILSRQVPDAEKRERADFIVDSGAGMEPARKQVHAIIAQLTAESDKIGE